MYGKFSVCFSTFIVLPAGTLQGGQTDVPEQTAKHSFPLLTFPGPPLSAPSSTWDLLRMSHPSLGRGQHRGTRILTPPPRPRTSSPRQLRGIGGDADAGGRGCGLPRASRALLYGRGGRGSQSDRPPPRERGSSPDLSRRPSVSVR